MNNIGELLKAIRESKNLTLKQLSELSGVGASSISDIENGKALNPRIETLVNLSNALDTPLNVLLDREEVDENKIKEYMGENKIFFSRFDKLSQKAKKQVIKMMEIFEDETKD